MAKPPLPDPPQRIRRLAKNLGLQALILQTDLPTIYPQKRRMESGIESRAASTNPELGKTRPGALKI